MNKKQLTALGIGVLLVLNALGCAAMLIYKLVGGDGEPGLQFGFIWTYGFLIATSLLGGIAAIAASRKLGDKPPRP